MKMEDIQLIRRACFTITMVTSIGLSPLAGLAFEEMSATIRVSNGALYDYVIIGEHLLASDGFDNAYDTISPGNLNSDMGLPFISAVIAQPDWKPAMRELRGDIRVPARKQQWQIRINSSLDKGTPLAVTLQPGPGATSQRFGVTLSDNKKSTDLRTGTYNVPAPGPGGTAELVVSVEQP